MKLLIGGSPCTHWSIAQTKNRETEASGIGWELFLNYRIARDKYQPDFFLYENNKSMAPAIKAQITAELGVEPVLINSALVSAQNRQRLYWVGKRNPDGTYSQVPVEQPEDRGILLRDILESGVCWREKAYTLKANYFKSSVTSAMDGGHFPAPMAAEPKSILVVTAPGKSMPVYEVRNGRIAIKGKEYPIKLADGFYIIRKLTVRECMRLQTVPEEYVFPVSATQAYKMLGNGWTVDVIAHIMSHFTGLTAEPVEVLSMYDGMSCGHIALDKLGVQPWLLRYYATEIDKYAIQTTQHNFPDTVQLGDAFQVRNDDWRLGDEL
jgi:site-specific DNA-cytosine methylase